MRSNGRSLITLAIAAALLLATADRAAAQDAQQSAGLAALIQDIFGPAGLKVHSDALLPDGSTHSAHFNSDFQSNFRQFDIALASQLTSLPLPSPASGFTYMFDEATGTFARSTQSFGPLLADRAETIGLRKMLVGWDYQYFSFDALEGVNLRRIPAVFTHDDYQLGGGLADIVSTSNAIKASVTQFTGLITYGAGSRTDIAVAIPLVRTSLAVISDAEIEHFGTSADSGAHYFPDPTSPHGYGTREQFSAKGSAAGVGDVVMRVKETFLRSAHRGFAAALEVRAPSGNEEDLLGSGAWGVKPIAIASFTAGRLSPHVNLGYQWNGRSVLAGDPKTGRTSDLPDRVTFASGADVGVNDRLTVAFDMLADRVIDSPRLTAETFHASGPLGSGDFGNIAFVNGSYFVSSGALGLKLNVAPGMLVNFNLRFSASHHGLTDKLTPLLGVEYGF